VTKPDPIWKHIRQALSASNGRRFDGDDNFKKCLVITIGMVDRPAEFAFEAKIPRSAVNDLFMSLEWREEDDTPVTHADAAAFLRDLAILIEEMAP
jgi:hypothetical protein